MTYQQDPYPAPPTPKRRTTTVVAILVCAIVGAALLLGVAFLAVRESADSGDGHTSAAVGTSIRMTTTTTDPIVYDVPSTDNLDPELTVIEKDCYGSAGCNFKYELRVVTTRTVTFDPTRTYRVTIVLDEGTSWEHIHSIEVKGSKAEVVTGSTSSDGYDAPVAAIQSIRAI